MAKLLRLVLGFIALVAILAFAISNRAPVDVALAPLPGSIAVPTYALFLLGLVLGVIIGGFGMLFGGWRKRREARRMRSRVHTLESELGQIRRAEERAEAERYQAGRTLAAPAGP